MTQRTTKTRLSFHPQLPLDIQFDAPDISSDAGVILLRQIDDSLGLTASMAACVPDSRDPRKVKHPRHEQLRQRVFQIAQGYEDCNDADSLRHDPLFKTVCDRTPNDEGGLSSQPTLSRLENAVDRRALLRLLRVFEKHYLDSLSPEAEVVILDIDGTDDPTHGAQQLTFFHGYYDQYMYHPLLVFDGESGQLISAVLRPGNTHASRWAKGLLRRLIRKIRRRCPQAMIVVRGDSGFCTPRILRQLERLNKELGDVDYLFGIARNPVLERLLAPTMEAARDRQVGSEKVIKFTSFQYAAKSWPYSRRILGKAEISGRGPNPRFLITSIEGFSPDLLYHAYCQRGQCENWIKDLKNALFADRLSCSKFYANSFRLLLHAMAYRLMLELRQEVAQLSTFFGRAQFDTLRLKLLRVGAQVSQSVRRILVRAPESFPQKALFEELLRRLARRPQPVPI